MISKVYSLFIFRYYLQSWRQSLLIVLGLALGVSVFVSIHLTVEASLRSFKNTVQAVSGKAQWQLVQEGKGIDENLFPAIKTHPMVQAAAPVVEFQASLSKQPGQMIWIMGVDFFSEMGIRRYSDSLSSIQGEDFLPLLIISRSIALTRDFAHRLGIKKGDILAILVNGRPEKLTVVALINTEGPARALDGHFGLMDIAQAQEVFGKIGILDRIDLVLKKDERGEGEQIRELEKIIPPGTRVVQPTDREKGTERMISSYQLNLTALSFIAVLVSMYLMYNTTSLSVARRRRDLGILRSLGMQPNQVLRLVLFEAAGYGLMGGIIGLFAGNLLARFLLDTVSRTINNLYVIVGVREISVSFLEAGIMVILSVVISAASAYFPARKAGRIEPREAISQKTDLLGQGHPRNRKYLFSGLFLLGLAVILTRVPPWNNWPIGGFSATLALTLGFSLLMPDFARVGIKGIMTLGFRGKNKFLPTWLGVNYVSRFLSRMAVAMAALMIAIAMLVSVSLMIRSFRQAVNTWINQSVSGDLFIGPVFPSNQVFSQFLQPEVLRKIENTEGISDIYRYRGLISEIKGFPVRLWSGDLAVIQRHGGLAFTGGKSEDIFRKTLTQEEILISEVLANQLSLKPGDSLPLRTNKGPHPFSVAGVFYDYRTEGGAVWMNRHLFLKYWEDPHLNGVRVYLKNPAQTHQVREAIYKKLAGQASLAIISNKELRDQILKIFDQTFEITYLLEAIAILVAFLGLIHSSSISVLFREKELGILKALGALPNQIRQMILTETTLMGIFSFIGGAIAGTLLSLVLIFVINKQSFGWTIPFYWSWSTYLQAMAIIVLGSILSGWIPARLAVKRSAQEMIREE